jgi:hypothetical protein
MIEKITFQETMEPKLPETNELFATKKQRKGYSNVSRELPIKSRAKYKVY